MRSRQADSCPGSDGVEDAPPPYREIVSRPPSWREDILSEKQAVEAEAEPRRRGVWRKIWDLLAGSKKASPQPSPRPRPRWKDEFKRTFCSPVEQPAVAPTSGSRAASKSGWAQPVTSHSLQPGRISGRGHRHKYHITRQHCPVPRMTPADITAAPWVAQLSVSCDDLAAQLPQHTPYLANLDRCWADQISTEQHPLLHTKRRFARTIKVAKLQAQGRRCEWAATVTIWHEDPQWLAALKYDEIDARFFQPESSLRMAALLLTADEPLQVGKSFYLHFNRPVRGFYYRAEPSFTGEQFSSRECVEAVLDVDEPALRKLVDEHLGAYLWKTAVEKPEELMPVV